jgi:tetratricopeptide (TPR) repeat protein
MRSARVGPWGVVADGVAKADGVHFTDGGLGVDLAPLTDVARRDAGGLGYVARYYRAARLGGLERARALEEFLTSGGAETPLARPSLEHAVADYSREGYYGFAQDLALRVAKMPGAARDRAEAWLCLGDMYRKIAGRGAEALASYETAAEAAGAKAPRAWARAAAEACAVNSERRDYAGALAWAERLRARAPESREVCSGWALWMEARSLEALGRWEDARGTYVELVAGHPDFDEVRDLSLLERIWPRLDEASARALVAGARPTLERLAPRLDKWERRRLERLMGGTGEAPSP